MVERCVRPAPGTYATGLKILVLAALLTALYQGVFIALIEDCWNDPALSHGLLIPPLAMWVAWMRRERTRALAAAPDSRGLLLVAAGCTLFLIGHLAVEFFLTRISFVVLLTGLAWTFWGSARVRTLALPLLLLATMVPLPMLVYNQLSAPLRLMASEVATKIAQWVGTSVYRDGNIVHLANISLGVEEACSGINSLSALLVASLLIGFLHCSRSRTRIVLLLVPLPLAIAINILRIAGTAIIADHYTQIALGFYHLFTGWLVFGVSFCMLYGSAKALHLLLD
jgi:exosortase